MFYGTRMNFGTAALRRLAMVVVVVVTGPVPMASSFAPTVVVRPTALVTVGSTPQWNTRAISTTTTTTTTTTAAAATTTALAGATVAAAEATSLVVVSPPGGVGEVTAVRAAERGQSVRWFVVSPETTGRVVLAPEALDRIAAAGGSVQLAGANVPSLLLPLGAAESAVPAVSTWCGPAEALVCTFDGVEPKVVQKRKLDELDPAIGWKDAIKVAAREAAKLVRGTKIAILSASDSEDMMSTNPNDDEEKENILSRVGNLFGNKADIPSTLALAMAPTDGNAVLKLRHGQLFGTPESSPEFSALVGGPRRDPELCEEYLMRAIRVDSTLSVSGNLMMGKTTRSSRHAIGEAAVLMILGKVPVQAGLDVCVSSQQGTDPVSDEEWATEFQRVQDSLSSGEAAQLFSTEFSSIPDTERLADWLATKWAPAVLRTYDIAAIRTGARPVIAKRAGPGKVEIVWQQLVDFDSVTVGRMIIEVTDTGLTAVRAPGNASKGFGALSRKPLAGEDVLVRRLAEAASQAIEKGLANKPKIIKSAKADKPKIVEVTAPMTSIVSSGDVAVVATKETSSGESGPRQAGVRRSTERKRKQSAPKAIPDTPEE